MQDEFNAHFIDDTDDENLYICDVADDDLDVQEEMPLVAYAMQRGEVSFSGGRRAHRGTFPGRTHGRSW